MYLFASCSSLHPSFLFFLLQLPTPSFSRKGWIILVRLSLQLSNKHTQNPVEGDGSNKTSKSERAMSERLNLSLVTYLHFWLREALLYFFFDFLSVVLLQSNHASSQSQLCSYRPLFLTFVEKRVGSMNFVETIIVFEHRGPIYIQCSSCDSS